MVVTSYYARMTTMDMELSDLKNALIKTANDLNGDPKSRDEVRSAKEALLAIQDLCQHGFTMLKTYQRRYNSR
jgi:hypothetical protein